MHQQDEIQKLVDKCRAGNNEAWRELADIYSGRCYSFFYRMSGNEDISRELVGELFLKLVEKIDSFGGGSFDRWIFTIASNLFNDYLRVRYRRKKLFDRQVEEFKDYKPEPSSQAGTFDKLQIMLNRLDKDTAELLVLRFYGELSFKELSELRKEPIGTTLSKVHRGLKKLKELMECSE